MKYLGVTIDNKLNFSEHIENTLRKVRSGTYLLQCNRSLLSVKAKLCIYHSIIKSHTEYCTEIWGNLGSKKDLNRLHTALKQGVRHVEGVGRLDHSDEIFKKHELLKFWDMVEIRSIRIGQALIDETLPGPIANLFKKKPMNNLRKNNMIFPTSASKLCKLITDKFNKLPKEIRNQADSKGGILSLFASDKISKYVNQCGRDCPSCEYKKRN